MSQSETESPVTTAALPAKLLTEVRKRIVIIRNTPVIADADVASLYGVETKKVNEAVRNNPDKFPKDYMFVLSADELIKQHCTDGVEYKTLGELQEESEWQK